MIFAEEKGNCSLCSVLWHDIYSIECDVYGEQMDVCVFRHKVGHCALTMVFYNRQTF